MKKTKSGFKEKGKECKTRGNRRVSEVEIKAICCNINGAITDFEEKMQHTKGFDIIGLLETWEEKDKAGAEEGEKSKIEKALEGYKVKEINAIRRHAKGRACGGMAIGIRENLGVNETWIESESTGEFLGYRVEIKKKTWAFLFVYMKERAEENYDVIGEYLENHEEEEVIILGDFNARTGEDR